MPTIGDVRTKLTAQAQPFVSGMKRAQASNARFRASIFSTGRAAVGITSNLKGVIASVLAFAVAVRALKAVAGAFLKFQTQMNNVRAITNASAADFQRLTLLARELGRTTKFTATEAAEGMVFLARTGLKVNQVLAVTPGVLNLAAATSVQFSEAANIATNVMRGMRLEVKDFNRVVDILAKTTTASNTDLRQLGAALAKVAPIAADAGESLETMAALVGVLGDAGIFGEEAGTALRRSLLNLTTGAGMAGRAIKRLQLRTTDASGQFVGFANIFDQLAQKQLKPIDLFELFGFRAITVAKILQARGVPAIEAFRQALEDAGGTADRMRRQQMAGFVGAAIRMRSALNAVAIAIGESLAPTLSALAERVTQFASALASQPAIVVAWANVVIKMVVFVIKTFQTLITTAFRFGQVIGTSILKIAIALANLQSGRLGPAIKQLQELRDTTLGAFLDVKDLFLDTGQSLTDFAVALHLALEESKRFGDAVRHALEKLPDVVGGLGPSMRRAADEVGASAGMTMANRFIDGFVNALVQRTSDIKTALIGLFRSLVADVISQALKDLVKSLKGAREGGGLLAGLARGALGGVLTGGPLGAAIGGGLGIAGGILGGDVIDPAPAGVGAEPGGGGIVIDMSRLPPPRNPLEAARDPIVVGFIAEALRTAQERGFRLR